MNRPKTILVTTDLSPTSRAALGPAQLLAETFGAKLIVLYVDEPVVLPVGYPGLDAVALEEHTRTTAADELKRFTDAIDLRPLALERRVAVGVPHLEIVRLAEEQKADLIVMATHGRGFFSHAFVGSTTERVIRRAPCPVLAVREPAAAKG
jgi:nucleotide-binding universal stress UspA family protein